MLSFPSERSSDTNRKNHVLTTDTKVRFGETDLSPNDSDENGEEIRRPSKPAVLKRRFLQLTDLGNDVDGIIENLLNSNR